MIFFPIEIIRIFNTFGNKTFQECAVIQDRLYILDLIKEALYINEL